MFTLMNHLMKKGLINYKAARQIIRDSLNDNLEDYEKDRIVDSLVRKAKKKRVQKITS